MKRSPLFGLMLALVLCLSLMTFSALAAETRVRGYPLPDHGTLELQVPGDWMDRVQQPPRSLPPTIVFKPNTGDPFVILLTPIWPASQQTPLPKEQKLRQMVTQSAERAKSQAVEKTIDLKELQGTAGKGFYFSATDRAPKPGEYKYLTQGTIRVGELMVTFTILTNDGQAGVVSGAMLMLKTASHK